MGKFFFLSVPMSDIIIGTLRGFLVIVALPILLATNIAEYVFGVDISRPGSALWQIRVFAVALRYVVISIVVLRAIAFFVS